MRSTATLPNGTARDFLPRTKVTFPTNIPTAITLEDGIGNLQAGAYGDQFRYWLTDNCVVWVDPPVHDQIQQTQPGPFDNFIITKSEQRQGSKRVIRWQVEKVEDEPAGDTAPPPAEPKPPSRAIDVNASAAKLAEPEAKTEARPQLVERPQLTAQHMAEGTLTECLMAALRAAKASEMYAGSIEFQLRWTPEDVRAMALSLYIDAAKRGGVR